MTPEQWTTTREVGGVLAAVLMSAWVAWKVRGRKDLTTPYSEELHGEQPRVISRKEWHQVVNRINVVPDHGRRIRELERQMSDLKETLGERLDTLTRLEAGFDGHVQRWEEVGQRAAEDRREMREDVRNLTAKVDSLLQDKR